MFSDSRSCEVIENSNFLIYVVAAIPMLSCFCLIGLGITQFVLDRNDMNRYRNRWYTRFNFFPTNRDIVLTPDNLDNTESNRNTVQAIPESQVTAGGSMIHVSHYMTEGGEIRNWLFA